MNLMESRKAMEHNARLDAQISEVNRVATEAVAKLSDKKKTD